MHYPPPPDSPDETIFRTPLPVEELSKLLGCGPAYVRLILDAGCPTRDGKVSMTDLSSWLCNNYDRVRALAGLEPLPEINGLELPSETEANLRVANTLLTALDFMATRSPDPETVQACNDVRRTIERHLDGPPLRLDGTTF